MPDTPDSYEGPARNGRKRYSNPTSVKEFITGIHTCTTSGTTMSDAELASGVRIKANGNLYVGGSNVGSTNGYELASNEEVFIDIDSMNKVFVMSSPAGSTASFIAS